jgi:cytochrome c-type biogenesis protein
MLVYLAVFFAGIISVISPCVLPLIPVIFASSMGKPMKGLFVVLGMILSFTVLGALFGTLGTIIPFREFGYLFLLGFAFILISDRMYLHYSTFASRHTVVYNGASPFILGAALGFIWSPCIGPIMGSVLSLAMIEGSPLKGSLLMLIYGLGLAVSIAAILKASSKIKISHSMENIRKFAGIIILTYVVLEVSGIMTSFQIFISQYTFGIEEKIAEFFNL